MLFSAVQILSDNVYLGIKCILWYYVVLFVVVSRCGILWQKRRKKKKKMLFSFFDICNVYFHCDT